MDLERYYDVKGVNPFSAGNRYRFKNVKTIPELVQPITGSVNLSSGAISTPYTEYNMNKGAISDIDVITGYTLTYDSATAVVATTPIERIELHYKNKVEQTFYEQSILDFNANLCGYDGQLISAENNVIYTTTPAATVTFPQRVKLPFASNLIQDTADFYTKSLPVPENDQFKIRIYWKNTLASIRTLTTAGTDTFIISSAPAVYMTKLDLSDLEFQKFFAKVKQTPFNIYDTQEFVLASQTSSASGVLSSLALRTDIKDQFMVAGVFKAVLSTNINTTTGAGVFASQSGFFYNTTPVSGLILENSDLGRLQIQSTLGFTPKNAYTYIIQPNIGSFYNIEEAGCKKITESNFNLRIPSLTGLANSTAYDIRAYIITMKVLSF